MEAVGSGIGVFDLGLRCLLSTFENLLIYVFVYCIVVGKLSLVTFSSSFRDPLYSRLTLCASSEEFSFGDAVSGRGTDRFVRLDRAELRRSPLRIASSRVNWRVSRSTDSSSTGSICFLGAVKRSKVFASCGF